VLMCSLGLACGSSRRGGELDERTGQVIDAAPSFYPGDPLAHHANFDNNGLLPVTSSEFGMSPFGAYNMAGNPQEWTINDTTEGRIATGGAWGEPTYTFAQYATLPRIADAMPSNFAPHIRAPKLIVQGRYDEDTPVKTQTEPLFKILSEPKEIEIYDVGHVAPTELVVTRVGGWLDKILGPVRR
jgi:pimeloyl-ACP methyl ester carboxylesterase